LGAGRNIGEAGRVGADTVGGGEAQAGQRAGDVVFSFADHDGVEIHPVWVDETEGRAVVGQLPAGRFPQAREQPIGGFRRK
jgi:hypothetical protein